MEFIDLAKKRYSVRKFSDKKVSRNDIDLILEAGRLAPTAVNYQPQRILVLDEEKDIEKLNECMKYHFNQTLAFVICYDKNISWKRKYDDKDMGEVDASIVATHMMLQAASINIGSTWIGHFKENLVRDKFNVPSNYEIIAILVMGHIHEDCKPHELHNNRLDLSETCFKGTF